MEKNQVTETAKEKEPKAIEASKEAPKAPTASPKDQTAKVDNSEAPSSPKNKPLKVAITIQKSTIGGIEAFRTALKFKAHHRVPKLFAANKPKSFKHNKACHVCHIYPAATVSWTDHNISEDHIANLIRDNGFGHAVQKLER